MLFRRNPRKRLEPVRVVGSPLFNCPLLHSLCNGVCKLKGQRIPFLNSLLQLHIDIFRESFPHHSVMKNIFRKIIHAYALFPHPKRAIFDLHSAIIASAPGFKSFLGSYPFPFLSEPASIYSLVALAKTS